MGTVYFAPVELPDGVTITKCVVYGSATDETWTLKRLRITDSTLLQNVSAQNFDTEGSFSLIVDNRTNMYVISTSTLDGDTINGARITYLQEEKS